MKKKCIEVAECRVQSKPFSFFLLSIELFSLVIGFYHRSTEKNEQGFRKIIGRSATKSFS